MYKYIVILMSCMSLVLEAVELDVGTATYNEEQIILQLEGITNPTAEEAALLAALASLSKASARRALDRLSGQQYTTLPLITEMVNRQFIRRLYDPLRPLIADPCACEDEFSLCDDDGFDIWVEGGGGRSFIDGNENAAGLKLSGYEITGGLQKRLDSCWTLGTAVSYVNDQIHYNIGGSGNSRTVLGAAYALYRPYRYYFLADFAIGYSENSIARRARVRTLPYRTHSKPRISQTTFYTEAGVDLCYCGMLFQPFLGLEVDYCRRSCIRERGDILVNLVVGKKDYTDAFSRLGIHMTTQNFPYGFVFTYDLAWQYRFTSRGTGVNERFAAFGTPFSIRGVDLDRNSIDFTMNVYTKVADEWAIFLEFSGERWQSSSSFCGSAGIQACW